MSRMSVVVRRTTTLTRENAILVPRQAPRARAGPFPLAAGILAAGSSWDRNPCLRARAGEHNCLGGRGMVHPCADAGRGHLLSSVADCHPRARTCNLPVVGVWHRSQAGGLLSPLCVLAHGMDLLRIPGRATESLDGRERNGAGSRPASVWHEQECSFRTPLGCVLRTCFQCKGPAGWPGAQRAGTALVSCRVCCRAPGLLRGAALTAGRPGSRCAWSAASQRPTAASQCQTAASGG